MHHLSPTILAIILMLAGLSRLAAPEGPASVGKPGPPRRCKQEDIPATITVNGDAVRLSIPPRGHAPGHPPQGWCGETAVQEALLFNGAYFPQRDINRAGLPRHADLYSHEIPVALKNLDVEFKRWPYGKRDLGRFISWVERNVRNGVPVLVGVKINPTKHKDWSLDHFVLAVGCDKDALTFNTTWARRERRTFKQLDSTQKGFSFKNRFNAYYGISISGLGRARADSVPVRLFVQKETADTMDVIVKCEGLKPGIEYVIHKLHPQKAKAAKPLHRFKATANAHAFYDSIDPKKPAVYGCWPIR